MVTESEIITALSGSILGDHPTVIEDGQARIIAADLFMKMLDVNINGGVDSILFYAPINANPSALALTQRTKLEDAIANVNALQQTLIASSQKIPYILNPDAFQNTPLGFSITPELRAALIADRQRLREIFRNTANVPTILSTNLT